MHIFTHKTIGLILLLCLGLGMAMAQEVIQRKPSQDAYDRPILQTENWPQNLLRAWNHALAIQQQDGLQALLQQRVIDLLLTQDDLSQAIAAAQLIRDPSLRYVSLARCAGKLGLKGERAACQRILKEVHAGLGLVSAAGYNRVTLELLNQYLLLEQDQEAAQVLEKIHDEDARMLALGEMAKSRLTRALQKDHDEALKDILSEENTDSAVNFMYKAEALLSVLQTTLAAPELDAEAHLKIAQAALMFAERSGVRQLHLRSRLLELMSQTSLKEEIARELQWMRTVCKELRGGTEETALDVLRFATIEKKHGDAELVAQWETLASNLWQSLLLDGQVESAQAIAEWYANQQQDQQALVWFKRALEKAHESGNENLRHMVVGNLILSLFSHNAAGHELKDNPLSNDPELAPFLDP